MSLSHDPPDGGKKPIRPPLRLVHPSSPKPLEKKHRRAPTFTSTEQGRLRAALAATRRAYGGRTNLAAAMGCSPNALKAAEIGRAWAFSADLAVRLSRVLAVPLESLFRAPTDASTCAACGARRTP